MSCETGKFYSHCHCQSNFKVFWTENTDSHHFSGVQNFYSAHYICHNNGKEQACSISEYCRSDTYCTYFLPGYLKWLFTSYPWVCFILQIMTTLVKPTDWIRWDQKLSFQMFFILGWAVIQSIRGFSESGCCISWLRIGIQFQFITYMVVSLDVSCTFDFGVQVLLSQHW
jgi:hypothetical protein